MCNLKSIWYLVRLRAEALCRINLHQYFLISRNKLQLSAFYSTQQPLYYGDIVHHIPLRINLARRFKLSLIYYNDIPMHLTTILPYVKTYALLAPETDYLMRFVFLTLFCREIFITHACSFCLYIYCCTYCSPRCVEIWYRTFTIVPMFSIRPYVWSSQMLFKLMIPACFLASCRFNQA